MHTSLRSAEVSDFDFCSRLHFAGMARIIDELGLDMARQVASFREHWLVAEVRVIMRNGRGVGWLQNKLKDDALFLAQIFVDDAFRRQGIGAEAIGSLIEEASSTGRDVTLGVVKSNPALRLYERLGFHITHQDKHKFYMRREHGG